jgi:hypothetical protein
VNLARSNNTSVTESLPTRLIPDMLERLKGKSPLMVLDVGMGVHETVEFFGTRRCRLHFSALHEVLHPPPTIAQEQKFGELPDKQAQDALLYQAWLQRFAAQMNYHPGTKFDLCLFWDFFNYLDDMALKAFSEVLSPYLSADTLAHAYLMQKPEHGLLNREYGICSASEISVRHGPYGHLPSNPRPQARVVAMLKDFSINHSVLRRDGLLETSLKSTLSAQ